MNTTYNKPEIDMKAELNIDIQGLADEVAQKVIREMKPMMEAEKPQDDTLLTVKALAEYLHVSDQWVYERVQKSEIPVIKVGKFPRFKKPDIDKWLDTLKTPAMNPLSRPLKIV